MSSVADAMIACLHGCARVLSICPLRRLSMCRCIAALSWRSCPAMWAHLVIVALILPCTQPQKRRRPCSAHQLIKDFTLSLLHVPDGLIILADALLMLAHPLCVALHQTHPRLSAGLQQAGCLDVKESSSHLLGSIPRRFHLGTALLQGLQLCQYFGPLHRHKCSR